MCEASLEKQPKSSEIGWGGMEEVPSVPNDRGARRKLLGSRSRRQSS